MIKLQERIKTIILSQAYLDAVAAVVQFTIKQPSTIPSGFAALITGKVKSSVQVVSKLMKLNFMKP